jgi:hypothetical protein
MQLEFWFKSVISLTCFLTVTYLRHYQANRGRQVGRTTSANGGRLATFSNVDIYTSIIFGANF